MIDPGFAPLAERNRHAAAAVNEALAGLQSGTIQQLTMGNRIGRPSEASEIMGGLALYYTANNK